MTGILIRNCVNMRTDIGMGVGGERHVCTEAESGLMQL